MTIVSPSKEKSESTVNARTPIATKWLEYCAGKNLQMWQEKGVIGAAAEAAKRAQEASARFSLYSVVGNYLQSGEPVMLQPLDKAFIEKVVDQFAWAFFLSRGSNAEDHERFSLTAMTIVNYIRLIPGFQKTSTNTNVQDIADAAIKAAGSIGVTTNS